MASSLAPFEHLALVNARGVARMHETVADAAATSPVPLDLAVLCIPAATCALAVRECASAGVSHVLICAGGFAEAGGAGVEYQAELERAAAETGMRVLGPNTSGFFVPPDGLFASFVPAASSLPPGRVAVVAASGGLNHALAFAFQRRGVGLSLGVGIGAGLDVATPEVLRYCADDTGTAVVAVHIESVADGAALLDAIAYTSRRKPVVVLVVGKHDVGDFALSHTGALATSWRTARALLAQAGAVIVDDEQQLVVACSTLASTRAQPTADPGAALVTAQAGPGLLVADALQGAGIRVPSLSPSTLEKLSELLPPLTYQANPVDTGRPGPQHFAVLSAVAADASIDLIGVYALAEPVIDLVAAVSSADLSGRACVIGVDGPDQDVLTARTAASEDGLALVVGPTELAVALDALAQDARQQYASSMDPTRDPPAPLATAPVCGPLTEAAAKDLLNGWGVTTPDRCLCSTEAEALAALERLGPPVAVKISSVSVLHKSEVGGVRLGVTSEAQMADAFRSVCSALRPLPGETVEVLVERMADPGVDLIVGARRDPVFGPVVVVGVGGVAAEVYADVAIAAVPTAPGRLSALLGQLRGRALVEGFRGSVPVDPGEVGQVAELLGNVLLVHPEVDEIEINPLRATPTGLVALDAVLVTRPDAEEERR
jgi:acetyltransferase